MNKLATIFGLAAVSASLGLMSACSSSSGDDSAAAGNDSGTDSSAHDGGATDTGVADTGGGNPDDTCTAMSTATACGQCCLGNHKTGATTITQAVIACACHGTGEADAGSDAGDGGAGPCATDCAATLCAATPAQPDGTCQTCTQNTIGASGACGDYVSGLCQADTDCVAEQTCIASCPK